VFGGLVGTRTGFFLALVEAVFDAVATVAKRGGQTEVEALCFDAHGFAFGFLPVVNVEEVAVNVANRAEAASFVGEVGGIGDAVAVARRVAVAAEGEFFAQVAFAVLFFAALAEGEAVVVVNVVVSLDEEAAGCAGGCARVTAFRARILSGGALSGSGPVGAVLHIRRGPAGDGSAESRGNSPTLNIVEILPCAEGPLCTWEPAH